MKPGPERFIPYKNRLWALFQHCEMHPPLVLFRFRPRLRRTCIENGRRRLLVCRQSRVSGPGWWRSWGRSSCESPSSWRGKAGSLRGESRGRPPEWRHCGKKLLLEGQETCSIRTHTKVHTHKHTQKHTHTPSYTHTHPHTDTHPHLSCLQSPGSGARRRGRSLWRGGRS